MNNTEMQLRAILQFDFQLELLSGMRIHGVGGGLEIGSEIDSNLTVIRDPATGEPYIPGSSLKGRIRSEAERRFGISPPNYGKPCACGKPSCRICPLFGAHATKNIESAPTRIVVREARYTVEYRNKVNPELQTETKAETMIDRKTGLAGGGSLRTGERVLPGACFQARILVQLLNKDTAEMESQYQDTIECALGQLEAIGAIGGSGSRGYGEVKIHGLSVRKIPISEIVLRAKVVG